MTYGQSLHGCDFYTRKCTQFKNILSTVTEKPLMLFTDKGGELENKQPEKLCLENKVRLFHSQTSYHASFIAQWLKVIVGGTPKIRHCFEEFLLQKAKNLKFYRFLLLKTVSRVSGSCKTKVFQPLRTQNVENSV